MHLGHAIGVFTGPRVGRKMYPAKLLKGSLSRRKLPVAVDRLSYRLVIAKIQTVIQWLKFVSSRCFAFDRKPYKIWFRLCDIKPEQAHSFAAPELGAKSIFALLIFKGA